MDWTRGESRPTHRWAGIGAASWNINQLELNGAVTSSQKVRERDVGNVWGQDEKNHSLLSESPKMSRINVIFLFSKIIIPSGNSHHLWYVKSQTTRKLKALTRSLVVTPAHILLWLCFSPLIPESCWLLQTDKAHLCLCRTLHRPSSFLLVKSERVCLSVFLSPHTHRVYFSASHLSRGMFQISHLFKVHYWGQILGKESLYGCVCVGVLTQCCRIIYTNDFPWTPQVGLKTTKGEEVVVRKKIKERDVCA